VHHLRSASSATRILCHASAFSGVWQSSLGWLWLAVPALAWVLVACLVVIARVQRAPRGSVRRCVAILVAHPAMASHGAHASLRHAAETATPVRNLALETQYERTPRKLACRPHAVHLIQSEGSAQLGSAPYCTSLRHASACHFCHARQRL